ncbi:hypothetical protein M8C21_022727, partial [Ambrosia artemisiifolia]
ACVQWLKTNVNDEQIVPPVLDVVLYLIHEGQDLMQIKSVQQLLCSVWLDDQEMHENGQKL